MNKKTGFILSGIILCVVGLYVCVMVPGHGEINGLYVSPAQLEGFSRNYLLIFNGTVRHFSVSVREKGIYDIGSGTLVKIDEQTYCLTLNYSNGHAFVLNILPSHYGFDISVIEAKKLQLPIESSTLQNYFACNVANPFGRFNFMEKVR